MVLGTYVDINESRDEIKLRHHTNIKRFLKKNDITENIKSHNVPCTPKLVKESKDYKYKILTRRSERDRNTTDTIQAVPRSNGTLVTNINATTKSHSTNGIEIYAKTVEDTHS
jgi:hypothetical protein